MYFYYKNGKFFKLVFQIHMGDLTWGILGLLFPTTQGMQGGKSAYQTCATSLSMVAVTATVVPPLITSATPEEGPQL